MRADTCEKTMSRFSKECELNSSLFNITTTINSALDFEKIMHAILSEFSQALTVDPVGIALRQENRWLIRYGYHLPQDILMKSFSDEEFPEAVVAMNTKGTVLSGPPPDTGTIEIPIDSKLNAIRPVLAAPLLTRGTTTGCLFFDNRSDPFTALEAEFAERAVALISLALENERLAQRLDMLNEQAEEEKAGLAALLEDIPAGVLIVGSSGNLIRGNEQANRILRQPFLQFADAGGFSYKGFHPNGKPYQPQEWPLARSITKGEIVNSEEIRVLRGDGTEGVINVSSGPIRDLKGRIVAGAMIIQDVTELKEAERAYLEAMIESTGQIVISLAKDELGIIRNWSKGAEKLYGYRAEEIIGRPVTILLPQGFPNDAADIIEKIKKGEPVEHHETVRMRKDGTLVPVSLNVSPVRDAEGRIIGASTITEDISDRRRIEEALKESELKFRKMASSARDAVVLINNEGMVEFWNEAATRMFGFKSEEIQGKYLHSFIMPERYAVDFNRGFHAFRSTGQGRFIGNTYEITARKKDGTEFPVELSLAAMKMKGHWNAMGIVRDITERKRADADLRRTLEQLERSNKELQQFAYVASHDLQEPLRTVSSFVELLSMKYKGKPLDEKAEKYIAFVVEGAHRMSTLINDLLEYSRVGTRGRQFQPVGMDEVLQQALGNLRSAIRENRADITAGKLPVVAGDQTQLVQLFQNLIANAIKFKKKDAGPKIRITAGRRSSEWVFGVHDNGLGMEPEYYERIFVIFQRLHTREEYPGTGVGLAICKRIVERHGGRIWVESKPGEGSSFYFSIPDRGSDKRVTEETKAEPTISHR